MQVGKSSMMPATTSMAVIQRGQCGMGRREMFFHNDISNSVYIYVYSAYLQNIIYLKLESDTSLYQ